MLRYALPRYFFFLCTVGAFVFAMATVGMLPDPVATKFAASGAPTATMSRVGYVGLMAASTAVLPAFLVAAIGVLPRFFPGTLNVPHRDYWLAPARRSDTLAFLLRQGYWLGALVAVLMGTLHGMTLSANRATPPGMPAAWTMPVLFLFIGCVMAWTLLFVRHFKLPAGTGTPQAAA